MKKAKYRILKVIETKGPKTRTYNLVQYKSFFGWKYLNSNWEVTLFRRNAIEVFITKDREEYNSYKGDEYYLTEEYVISRVRHHAISKSKSEFSVTIEKEIEI